jgi:hypothetical protein
LLQKNISNPNQNTPDYEVFTKDITLKDAVSRAVENSTRGNERQDVPIQALFEGLVSSDDEGDEGIFYKEPSSASRSANLPKTTAYEKEPSTG